MKMTRVTIASNDDDESDVADNQEEDDETRRIRARMERAMDDMEDSDDDMDDDDDESNVEDNVTDNNQEDEEESLEDPAANELNDGFFDINEMEAFADEEEEYLPEAAFGTTAVQPKADAGEKKKSFHQKQRDGDMDSGSDDDRVMTRTRRHFHPWRIQ